MKVSSTLSLPDKDFKAVVKDGRIWSVGIEFFNDAMEAQAIYKLCRNDWKKWLDIIIEYCENGKTNCYAEVAFNEIASECRVYAFDARDRLCTEIDTPEDLFRVSEKLTEILERD